MPVSENIQNRCYCGIRLKIPTFIGGNRQGKVEEIGGIGEVCLHCRRQVKFSQVWSRTSTGSDGLVVEAKYGEPTFLYSNLRGACLWFLLRSRILVLLHTPNLFEHGF